MEHIQARAAFAGIALFPFLLLSSVPAAADGATIGSINNASGHVVVERDGLRLPAHPGFKLRSGDILESGPDGSLGLVLRDDSRLSLGPSSRVAIEKFVFLPVEGKLGFTARLLRGTIAYVSGLIGRLAPESATFVTPVATIGVRGTHFVARVSE